MSGSTITAGPHPGLIQWLEEHHVAYELHEHPLAYTAAEAARAEGVAPRTFTKVVGVRTSDGRTLLVALDASDQVDLGLLRQVLEVEWAALLDEESLRRIMPECEAGTIPPIPQLAGVPVLADEAVRVDDRISFHAGTHRHAVRVDREAWDREAGISYGRVAGPRRSLRSLSEHGWT